MSFAIDQDVFNAKANIRNVTQNALVDAVLKGTINLGNLSKAYPIKLDKPLSGILKADVTTKFDMQSVEKSQYQNINNSGTMSLSGFKYADENGKTITISNALVQFNPKFILNVGVFPLVEKAPFTAIVPPKIEVFTFSKLTFSSLTIN